MDALASKSRDSELTAVHNRSGFDAVPGNVTDPKDIERWHDFRAKYHAAHRLEKHFDFPLQLDFELNSTCQMKCSFCLHGIQKVQKKLLTFDLFQQAIDEGSKHGLCSIKLNYINEPLLLKDLERYVRYARYKGVLNVYFATNGLLLSEQRAAQLIEVGVTKIMVSLDAVTAETFERMRHNKRFDDIVANVEGLIRLRNRMGVTWPLVRVNFVKTPLNYHEADAFIDKWTGVADMIGFQDQVGIPGVDTEMLTADTGRKPLDDFRCSFPYKMIVIDSDGNLLPCCTFSGRQLALGNLRDLSIKAAWDSIGMRALKQLHFKAEGRKSEVCAHCIGS